MLDFLVTYGPVIVLCASLLASIIAPLPFAPAWLKGLTNLVALNLDKVIQAIIEALRTYNANKATNPKPDQQQLPLGQTKR